LQNLGLALFSLGDRGVGLSWNYRQHHIGGETLPVVDTLVGHFHPVILTDRRSGVGVTIKTREITAGYIKPNPVALFE